MHLTSRWPCWMIKTKAFLSSGKSTLFSYLCIELFSSLVALSRGCNPRIFKPYLWLCIHVSWCFDSSFNNFIKYEIAAYTIKGVVRTVRKSCPSVNIFKVYVPYLNPEIQKWINSLLFIFLDNVSSSFVSGSSGLGFSSRYKRIKGWEKIWSVLTHVWCLQANFQNSCICFSHLWSSDCTLQM